MRLALWVAREARTGQHCFLRPALLQLATLPLFMGAAKPAKPVPVPRPRGRAQSYRGVTRLQTPGAKGQGGHRGLLACQPGHTGTAPGPGWALSAELLRHPESGTAGTCQASCGQTRACPLLPLPPLDSQRVSCQCHQGKRPRNLSGRHDRRQGNVTKMTHKHFSPPNHSHQDEVPPPLLCWGHTCSTPCPPPTSVTKTQEIAEHKM